jgi:hypothetical protein
MATNRLRFPKGQKMPRLTADIRISLKKRGGATHRIELVRQPVGKRSTKVPEATASQIAERNRRWLVANS